MILQNYRILLRSFMLLNFWSNHWSRKLSLSTWWIQHIWRFKIHWSAQKLIFFLLSLSIHKHFLYLVILSFSLAQLFHMTSNKWIEFKVFSFRFKRALSLWGFQLLKIILGLSEHVLDYFVVFYLVLLV